MSVLEQCVRESLEPTTPRALGVLRPIKLIIDNYPAGVFEEFDIPNHPNDPSAGSRKVMFGREIYIDEADFLEDPPRRFFRLSPGREVRLRYAYYVTCVGVDRDSNGDISTIHCTYDPDSRGGGTPDKRKVKGTLHWVSAAHALTAQARLYEPLFYSTNPLEDPNVELTDQLNATSRTVIDNVQLESNLQHAAVGTRVQLERIGYFCVDPDTQQDQLVLNQIVALRDSLPRDKPS
jgi:glutaminyl-tRNA synthetase